jgi:hypothetical protein
LIARVWLLSGTRLVTGLRLATGIGLAPARTLLRSQSSLVSHDISYAVRYNTMITLFRRTHSRCHDFRIFRVGYN